MNKATRSIFLAIATMITISPVVAPAHETDQFTNRAEPITDSTAVLDREMNKALAQVVGKHRHEENRMALVNAIYRRLGGRFLVDRIEKWAIKSPEVEKARTSRYRSIYSRHPVWAVRVTKFFGVGETISVNNQHIGTDKLGHFISQGRKYYRRFLRYGSEEKAGRQSARAEWAVFGQMSNGNFSNADLVANYEGHRFFRSLFEDDITPGKLSILRWSEDGWVIQRPFDWADHVNEYWDEALNINHFDSLLYGFMYHEFISLCPRYWRNPDLYTIADEQPLRNRYAHLGMRDNSVLRLDSLCPTQAYLQIDILTASSR